METYGYDLCHDNVLDVSRRAQSLGLTVQLYYGDIDEALARGDTFDFIKASQVIEHMIDPVGFVTADGLASPPGASRACSGSTKLIFSNKPLSRQS
jgi:2-polyprenyl-3-methyl-5-hydroxy-6-metoxy-1,4-benzoquinol methylase